LRDGRTSKASKSAAGSTLAQKWKKLVDLFLSVFEALEAVFFPVTFLFFLFPMFFSY
jgi:hypothetical protein